MVPLGWPFNLLSGENATHLSENWLLAMVMPLRWCDDFDPLPLADFGPKFRAQIVLQSRPGAVSIGVGLVGSVQLESPQTFGDTRFKNHAAWEAAKASSNSISVSFPSAR
jgi:hypothetical protein